VESTSLKLQLMMNVYVVSMALVSVLPGRIARKELVDDKVNPPTYRPSHLPACSLSTVLMSTMTVHPKHFVPVDFLFVCHIVTTNSFLTIAFFLGFGHVVNQSHVPLDFALCSS
jgi:hypothetical protein